MPGQNSGGGWAREVFDMANVQGLAVALHGVPGAYGWLGHGTGEIDIATESTLWGNAPSLYPWQTSAQTLEAVSDDAADDAGGTGTGKIWFIGLDENWDLKTVEIVLDGVTPVELPGLWIRSIRTITDDAGLAGTNVGTIKVQVASGGDVLSVIKPGWGESSDGVMSVARGFVGLPTGFASVLRGAKAGQFADLGFMVRLDGGEDGKPWRIRDRIEPFSGGYRPYVPPTLFTEKTDFEIRSFSASKDALEVTVSMSFLIAASAGVPSPFLITPQVFERGG